MRGREIVAKIMGIKKISNAELAHKLDISVPTMWDRINTRKTKDIPISTMNEMVRVMDYKIIVVPSNRQIKENEFEVTNAPPTPIETEIKNSRKKRKQDDLE